MNQRTPSKWVLMVGLTLPAVSCRPINSSEADVSTLEVTGDPDTDKRYTGTSALGSPPPIDPSVPGATYLTKVASRIQPAWAVFLDDCRLRLPPTSELNVGSLQVRLQIVLTSAGEILNVSTAVPSGNSEFDEVAVELIKELRAFPKPPIEWISDDEHVHLEWGFARDIRQAGASTAKLNKVELPLAQAVPKLLSAGLTEVAAQRIVKVLDQGNLDDSLVEHVDQVAVRIVELALQDDNVLVVAKAIEIAAVAKLARFAPAIRLAVQSTEMAVATAAVKALGAIGGKSDYPLLMELAAGKQGPALSASAATSLQSLGQGKQVTQAALAGLKNGNRVAALAVLTELVDESAVAPLTQILLGARTHTRSERLLAAGALGRQAVRNPNALKTLVKLTDTGDAVFRTSCIAAIADAAEIGLRNRLAFWKVVELIKSKDERVRAAAIRAAANLDAKRFQKEFAFVRSGNSELVRLSMIRVLSLLPGDLALGRLLEMATKEDVASRLLAATSLVKRAKQLGNSDKVGLALGTLRSDSDAGVRLAALPSAKGAEALGQLLSDSDPLVQAAALQALVGMQPQDKSLKLVASRFGTPSSPASHLRTALSWLTPKTKP